VSQILDLVDYRRQVDEIYLRVRDSGPGPEPWERWTGDRDRLFATHPQSPVEDRSRFTGLPYFPYDERWRVTARFEPVEEEAAILSTSGSGTARFIKAGTVLFELSGRPHQLDLLWLDAYGGGAFLPFRDQTNGVSTYGGGRYLLDTAKGADLGHDGDELILDFNYAYHPSCVHSTKWVCPLAPPDNHLDVEITAGERLALPG
jgi:uncharacterized protein (DUF1684 family)